MSGDIILETEDLTKEFAGFVAVNGVSLRVARGSIHALIGPNGAGKTTCFNLLTKFLAPTRGASPQRAATITALPADRDARLGLVRSFPDLGGVRISPARKRPHPPLQRKRGGSSDIWRSKRVLDAHSTRAALALLADVGLADYADLTAVELPYGRKRAHRACHQRSRSSPEMLLLDEPTAEKGPRGHRPPIAR
jgi:branched-chain amino acid transport system ATP-binding protein